MKKKKVWNSFVLIYVWNDFVLLCLYHSASRQSGIQKRVKEHDIYFLELRFLFNGFVFLGQILPLNNRPSKHVKIVIYDIWISGWHLFILFTELSSPQNAFDLYNFDFHPIVIIYIFPHALTLQRLVYLKLQGIFCERQNSFVHLCTKRQRKYSGTKCYFQSEKHRSND